MPVIPGPEKPSQPYLGPAKKKPPSYLYTLYDHTLNFTSKHPSFIHSLLLLVCRRSHFFIKSPIGNLQTSYRADSHAQNSNEDKAHQETHEEAFKTISRRFSSIWDLNIGNRYIPGDKNWYFSNSGLGSGTVPLGFVAAARLRFRSMCSASLKSGS